MDDIVDYIVDDIVDYIVSWLFRLFFRGCPAPYHGTNGILTFTWMVDWLISIVNVGNRKLST